MSGEQRYEIGSVQGGTHRTIRIAIAVEPVLLPGELWQWRVQVSTTVQRQHPLPGMAWQDHLTPGTASALAALLVEAHELASRLPTPTGPAPSYPDIEQPNASMVRAD